MDINTQAKLDRIGQYVYSTKQTQLHSYQCGKEIIEQNIPGDIIECGVAAAGNFASMMLGVLDAGGPSGRKFWGFDSFQGIQLAGKNDKEQPGIGTITHDVNVPEEELLKSSGVTSVSRQQVIKNLTDWGLYGSLDIELVEGWIQHTLPQTINKIGAISILRLDMDIYDPTLYALMNLYPFVSKGGIIIIDDWALEGAQKACKDFFKLKKIKPKMLDVPDSTPKYFYKK